MSATLFQHPPVAGSSALAADGADPNTTEPDDTRKFQGPVNGRMSIASPVYVLALGGAVTVQLWTKLAGRWWKVGATQACAQDTLTYLPTTPPVDATYLYVQYTGTPTATQVLVGLQGSR